MATPNPSDAVTAVSSGSDTLYQSVLGEAQHVLPYAAIIAGIFVGWRIVRRFVK